MSAPGRPGGAIDARALAVRKRLLGWTWAPVAEPGRGREVSLLHLGAILAAGLIVYGPFVGQPLRLWDHHVILLLAKAPQFAGGLFWHLVHYRIGFDGFSDDTMYFRVLSMPLTWGLAWLFQDHGLLYYGTHLLLHAGVAAVLYALAIEVSGDRTLSVLAALLFTVFCGQGDTVNLPVYSFMLVAVLLAGTGLLGFLRFLRSGRVSPLLASVTLVTAATLVYDAFFLLALALPLAALLVAIRAGGLDGRATRAAVGLLAGVLVVFLLVLGSVRFSPAAQSRPDGGAARSLRSTVSVLVREGRLIQAAGFGVHAIAADAQVFLTGHFPGIWHRGNLPYWDLNSLRRLWGRLGLALGLMLAGAVVVGAAGRRWWPAGMALLAAGAWVDWRTGLLALPLALALRSGRRAFLDPRVLLVIGAGVLVSFNIALGRANGYNVAAFRHHYVTGFFVVLGLVTLLGAAALRSGGVPRRLALLSLAACVVLNAAVTLRILEGIQRDNAMVFDFDRALTEVERQNGPRSLLVAFSPSFVRGADWRGFPLQDVAFDILHYQRNPMTRYSSRARLVVGEDGGTRPNPLHGQAEGGDFLFRFRLAGLPPGTFEVFGAAAHEPRIVLSPAGIALRVRRRADGVPVAWGFPLSPAAFPAVVTLAREGDTLRVTVGDTVTGEAALPPGDAYHPWESDNAGLLGRGFERVAAGSLLFDTYVRIGPVPEAESRGSE